MANTIAGKIRTSGVLMKDSKGEKIIGKDGIPKRIHGRFEALQAAGWMYNPETSQVSMNLLDYNVTGLDDVTEAVREEALKLGIEATAGELVGLVPLGALIQAGEYYLGESVSFTDEQLVELAISSMNLADLDDFNKNERIIEWAVRRGGNID